MSYNMRILLYLFPCCGVLAARFSNLPQFECSHRRDTITYTQDIFHNKCKRPHHVTRKMSNLYIVNKYYHLTLQKKFRLLLNKGVPAMVSYHIAPINLLSMTINHIRWSYGCMAILYAGYSTHISETIGHVALMAIIGTIILLPYV